MPSQQQVSAKRQVSALIKYGLVGVGCTAIVILFTKFCATLDEHMTNARETSRNTQWLLHAPTDSARAAAALEGLDPQPLTRPHR